MAIGCFCAVASALLLLCAVLVSLAAPEKAVPVWVYGLLLVVFLGGVQLIAIGMLGQYVGRIYEQTNERPMYVIGEQVNFEPSGGNAGPDG